MLVHDEALPMVEERLKFVIPDVPRSVSRVALLGLGFQAVVWVEEY
jgi:hypothetical protein